MKKTFKIVMIVSVLLVVLFIPRSYVSAQLPELQENSTHFFINTSKAFISATPKTTSGGFVDFEAKSKLVNVTTNVGFLFNTTYAKPIGFQVWNPTNVSRNVTIVESNTTVNITENITVNWSDTNKSYTKYNVNFNNKDSLYLVQNVFFEKGVSRKVRVFFDVDYLKIGEKTPSSHVEKYDVVIVPSAYGSNLVSAFNDDNLFILDPLIDLTDGLVMYFDFNSSYNDSANRHNLTSSTGSEFKPGFINNSLNITSNTPSVSFSSVAVSEFSTGDGNKSWSAWIYPTPSIDSQAYFFWAGVGGIDGRAWDVQYDAVDKDFGGSFWNGAWSCGNGVIDLSNNTWTHVVQNVFGENDTIQVWMNNELLCSVAMTVTWDWQGTISLFVGSSDTPSQGWLNSMLDEYAFYDKALTQEEINVLYGLGRGNAYSFNVPPINSSDPSNNRTDNDTFVGDVVRFNITLEDDVSLHSYIFSQNSTGSFVNDSPVNIEGNLTWIANTTYTVNATNMVVCGRYYFNDTFGWNGSSTADSCFLSNYSNPVLNEVTLTPSISFTNDTLIGSCNASIRSSQVGYNYVLYEDDVVSTSDNFSTRNDTNNPTEFSDAGEGGGDWRDQDYSTCAFNTAIGSGIRHYYANYTNPINTEWFNSSNVSVEAFGMPNRATTRLYATGQLSSTCIGADSDKFRFYYLLEKSGTTLKLNVSCWNSTAWEIVAQENVVGDTSKGDGFCEADINSSQFVTNSNNILVNVVNVSTSSTSKDTNWTLSCQGYDGFFYSDWTNSSAVLIVNYPPEISSVNVSPINASLYHNLTFVNASSDIDNDGITNFSVQWYENGSLRSDLDNLTLITPSNFSIDENWSLSLMVYDGNNWSTTLFSTNLSIQADNTTPNLYNDTLSSSSGVNNAPFNIFINASDDSGTVSSVTVEITDPNTIRTNFSMTDESNGRWNRTYTPSTDGIYSFYFYAEDNTGNIGEYDSNLTYFEDTAGAPPPAGGGGGGTTVIIEEGGGLDTFSISPETTQFGIRVGGLVKKEFRIVVEGLGKFNASVSVNKEQSSSELVGNVLFDNEADEVDVEFDLQSGFETGTRFVRYTVDLPPSFVVGEYLLVLDVELNGEVKNHVATVLVGDSFLVEIQSFLNNELFSFDRDFCVGEGCDPKSFVFVFRVWHLIAFVGMGLATIQVVTNFNFMKRIQGGVKK